MLPHWLLAAHIAVLGYWLGSELVINSTFRFVCYRTEIAFVERNRMMDHVMDVDQHVRYALVLQAGTGFALAALYGYVPGNDATAIAAGLLALLALLFIELVHRQRGGKAGPRLALVDRSLRYVAIIPLLLIGLKIIGAEWSMPTWLRLKLLLFGGVIGCGIGIRFALIRFFRSWTVMTREGPSEAMNSAVRRTYWQATSTLILLWILIAAIVVLSVAKPAMSSITAYRSSSTSSYQVAM